MSSNNVNSPRALIGGEVRATLRMGEGRPGEREFLAKYEPRQDHRLTGVYLNTAEEFHLYVHSYQHVPDDQVQFILDDIIFSFKKLLPPGRYDLPHDDLKIIADYRFSGQVWIPEAGYIFLSGVDPSSFRGNFEAYKNKDQNGPAIREGVFEFKFE
ncbi:hypothetical protein ACQKP7_16505 [Pseudomonas frederiksbergensis]|uniref:hypothetical protein n=1 Tax=Pseudomonas frederiksbergensis TaxID=104087 RepID=UPI003D091028